MQINIKKTSPATRRHKSTPCAGLHTNHRKISAEKRQSELMDEGSAKSYYAQCTVVRRLPRVPKDLLLIDVLNYIAAVHIQGVQVIELAVSDRLKAWRD